MVQPKHKVSFSSAQIAAQSYTMQIQYGLEANVNLQPGELLKLKGPAIFLSRISNNGRHYIPESVHAQVAALQDRISMKALFGELDHPPVKPGDPESINRLAYVMLKEASHRIDALVYNASTDTYDIEVTILDTPNGRILKSIYDAGSPLFVSLRSLLDPTKNVQRNGYIDAWMLALITIDFVSRPGFSDAILTPIEASNENLVAVCEALNIQNNYNLESMSKEQMYAIESIVGEEIKPTDDFMAKVNAIILDVKSSFPNKFLSEDFNKKYNGEINGYIVGLYSDTAEIEVQDLDNNCHAAIQLLGNDEDGFVLRKDADVTYFKPDTLDTANEHQYEVVPQYAVIAEESALPDSKFSAVIADILAYLTDRYSDGFKKADVDAILADIKTKWDLDADMLDNGLQVNSAITADKAIIGLSNDDELYRVNNDIVYNPVEQTEDDKDCSEGIEYYAIVEGTEGDSTSTATTVKDTIDDAEQHQQYATVNEEDNEGQQSQDTITVSLYKVIEDEGVQTSYAVVDEDDDDNDDKDSGDYDPKKDVIPGETGHSNNELATEAQEIFGMPNSKFEGHYAIEHMPTAYKHLWSGLSKEAREIIAKQSETIATEAQSLKFWQNTNFVAIESYVTREAMNIDMNIEIALEALPNPLAKFLGEPLPSSKRRK